VNLVISAQSTDGKQRFDITVQKVGTTFAIGEYDSDNLDMDITLTKNFGTPSAEYYRFGYNATFTNYSHFKIKLTSITADRIQGSFVGNFLVNQLTGTVLEVTEGEFSVKR
jgi:hypothetical protein